MNSLRYGAKQKKGVTYYPSLTKSSSIMCQHTSIERVIGKFKSLSTKCFCGLLNLRTLPPVIGSFSLSPSFFLTELTLPPHPDSIINTSPGRGIVLHLKSMYCRQTLLDLLAWLGENQYTQRGVREVKEQRERNANEFSDVLETC